MKRLVALALAIAAIAVAGCNAYNGEIEFKCAGHDGVAAVDGDRVACNDGHRAKWGGEGW